MSVTQQDLIDYFNPSGKKPYNFHYSSNGKIYFYHDAKYGKYPYTTLPNGIIHLSGSTCDLWGSDIAELPDDIVLNGSLCVYSTPIKEINTDVGEFLDIRKTDVQLKDGIYIGWSIMSLVYVTDSTGLFKPVYNKYSYLDGILIGGYLFSTGVLS